jgi:hypothetical protein
MHRGVTFPESLRVAVSGKWTEMPVLFFALIVFVVDFRLLRLLLLICFLRFRLWPLERQEGGIWAFAVPDLEQKQVWERSSGSDLFDLGEMAGRIRRLIAYRSFQALFADSVLYDWRLL